MTEPRAGLALRDADVETQEMSIYRCLYGNRSGDWAIVEAPVGLTSMPTTKLGKPHDGVHTLISLGDMQDVFTRLHRALTGPGRPRAQQVIADAIGVQQQTVSRVENGQTEPRLTDEQLRALVRFYFEVADG